MDEEKLFRLWNYYEDGKLRDLYECTDLDDVHGRWLDEVVARPRCRHSIQLQNNEVLWDNDLSQADAVERGEEPRKVWVASPEEWETEKMRRVPWWNSDSDG
jgi:hypothetical protein